MARYDYSKANCPEIESLAGLCTSGFPIDTELYTKYDVKRGLRDLNGKGVLAGLTHIGNVCASKIVDGQSVPCDGKLYYEQSPNASYSVKSDYYWYEIGDIVSIGTNDCLYFCFPKEGDIVAKTRIAAEELYKLSKGKGSSEKD